MLCRSRWIIRAARAWAVASLFGFTALAATAADNTPDFQRDVRPILSKHCFKCHGPDAGARKSKLRLDLRDAALGPAGSGLHAIVPGKPDESELVRRIFSSDPDELMPPPETKLPLSESQKRILKGWVAAGAVYEEHWAFIPPKQPPLPKVKRTDWPQNEIDYFVLARLEAQGLEPSPRADKYTLVRRLYLDLIGLPPTPEEAAAFDDSPEGYAALVDKLLASPHYGERWARRWLDLARYADTNGYEKDRRRSIWPYRDWVINAINQGMPFDQFTIEQIAGDLLPNAGLSQRVATGFHRNTMLNEEGGIDPLEFRFYAMVDRVNTTATTWLGLTMACAQCHTHKFDPIEQREYYEFMAFLNNADEPEIEVPSEEVAERRAEIEKQIEALTRKLPDQFPVEDFTWHPAESMALQSGEGTRSEPLEDDSFRISGENADTTTYTVELETDLEEIGALRLELLPDPALPKNGPGRSENGEALVSEITLSAGSIPPGSAAETVKIAGAEGDASSRDKAPKHAIDEKTETGWLIRGGRPHAAVFKFDRPVRQEGGTRLVLRIEQQSGKGQNIGRFRITLGRPIHDPRPIEVRRREQLERKFNAWLQEQSAQVVKWIPLRPVEATSNLPLLTILEDNSVFASGDQTKSDTYRLKFKPELQGITAFRLEALPDERLPRRGPGRVYYEGPAGDFTLCEWTATADGKPIPFSNASHSYAAGRFTAPAAIDGNPQTGWSIDGGQGRAHQAVFNLAAPLDTSDAAELEIKMLFERHYSAGLGRFRISATTNPAPAQALALPVELQELLLIPEQDRTSEQRDQLLAYYLSVAPELAEPRRAIAELRRQMPSHPTTLVMEERPPQNPRPTYLHKRGEFLQPVEPVTPDVPSILHPLPEGAPRNRLTFARWLVDPRSPLVGRVTMNRHWAAFFGEGLVRTIGDFGYQGDLPTHPDLLDWLAVEFVRRDWSIKAMHRLIVTSATYQQASLTSPELLRLDPGNHLLARGARFRLEAELIRDAALKISGLLSPRLGGPSVFPPQPPGVTTEGAYGALEWKVSDGGNRYRRGLYTFSKRTAPYAMFSTFDAPSGEACVARREPSNTPLQALTLLNDDVFAETAQALGRTIATLDCEDRARATDLFRRCLIRPPSDREIELLLRFYEKQKARLQAQELDAARLAGSAEGPVIERAAWTLVARALLNLDETISRN